MTLPDQAARDSFAFDTGRNFSVIAPAGVGKTTAIALRVLEIARGDARMREGAKSRRAALPAPRLPRLVVVTYTRKAADELRNRARAKIVEAGLSTEVLGWFNEAFFGTIHSFCLELLRRFGPLAGLPARLTVEPEDSVLRLTFQRDTADVADFLPESARKIWQRHGSADEIWNLVWGFPSGAKTPPPPGKFPAINLQDVYAYQPKQKRAATLENIRQMHEQLRRWEQAPDSARALDVPEIKKGGEAFVDAGNRALLPLREWLAAAAAHAAAGIAEAFGDFKEQQGGLGYNDIARPVLRLLRDPAIARRIHAQEFSVLLDEAQDTDPAQFAVLAGVAQPAGAEGLWTEGKGAPPAPGRFSMVGDPQQSIFGRDHAGTYLRLHRQLVAEGAAEQLIFAVTMRCDEAIVAHVNESFARLLDGQDGQADFVKLFAKPKAGPGGVWRLRIEPPANFPAKPKTNDYLRAEAKALAAWLQRVGPAGVGAENWREVAVLAARKKQLNFLAAELREQGIAVQIHADDRARGADPARTWLGALLGILADPADDFEMIGVWREIFGISDDEIYQWRKKTGQPTPNVLAAVKLLQQLQRAIIGVPLREAVSLTVGATQLRERLAAIGTAPSALGALLDQAVMAEARGDDLAAFAPSLLRGPAEAVEPVVRPDEVQLLTSYKAKGLEWPVVIHFGLFLEPGFPSPDYPCWRPSLNADEPPSCLFDSGHAATGGAWSLAQSAVRQAEFERLLYVAATRPKHTLILSDAEALFAEPAKNCRKSLLDIFGALPGGLARVWWEGLPAIEKAIEPPGKILADNVSIPATDETAWPVIGAGMDSLEVVRDRAGKFTRRVRPSSLAHHTPTTPPERTESDLLAPPDYPEEQAPPTEAVDYGNWWHGVMERTPWHAGPAAWGKYWQQSCEQADGPTGARARLELEKLRLGPLAQRLATPGLEFAVELPFLFSEPENSQAFDGCLDLAVWDEKAAGWLIIDWKTDRVESDAAVELRRRYGPQVEVYARALHAMTKAPVETLLYSTRTGVLVPV